MNKYNLQVGDKIRIFSVWEITEITEVGITFESTGTSTWSYVNERLDKGTWSIEERAPSIEYKVGDVVSFEAFLYEHKVDKSYRKWKITDRNIETIEGEFFQLENDSISWFKLSDLPPKTENIIKMYYEIGDIVVWKPTGKIGTIASEIMTDGVNKDCYNLDINGDRNSHNSCHYTNLRKATPEEIKQYNMKEKKIIGYTMVKSFPGAKAPVTFNTKNDKDEWGSENIDWYFSQQEIDESPDWFIPIYKAKKTILKLGDRGIEVKIGEKSITADGKAITRNEISELLNFMEGENKFSYIGWPVTFPTVKVGCTTFTQAEVDTILGTYDDLNP